jgi:hypothetical protein
MSKNFKFITVALSILFCFTAIAFGQRTTGNITGTVTDPNGAVISGATVTVRSVGTTTGFNRTFSTNSDGYFQVSQIPPGTYEVTITQTGFKTTKKEVTVSIDKDAIADTQLEVGQAGETVTVTSDSDVTLDPSDTKIDSTIGQRLIEDLPRGTTFASLLKVAPNVRPELGGFQIDGASGSENVFIIDGQEVTNFRTGVLNGNFNLPFELVQEVQVKSTGYEAEFGGATGGVVNVVTVGGNDQWHGNFGMSFQPSKLQGRFNTILNRFSTNDPGNVEKFQPRKDGGTNYFPVARFSGPIIKEKVWFSAIYAPQVFDTTRFVDYYTSNNPNTRVLTQTLKYNQHFVQEEAFARIDAAPTSRLRWMASFLWNPIKQEGVLPATTEGLGGSPQSVNFGGSIGTLSGPNLLGRQGGRQNANAFNTQATWNPNNFLVANFRYGRSFLNEKLNSYFLPKTTRYICSAVPGGFVTPAQAGCSQGFQNVANNSQREFDVSTRNTIDADVSLNGINIGGRHNFKFGYQFNRLFNTVSLGYVPYGIIQLFYETPISALAPVTPSAPICNSTNFPNCVYGSGLMTRFGTVGEASSSSHGLFAQDSWTINNRVTLNLGIRIENETVPNFGDPNGSTGIKFGWGDKISPRLGVAFDPIGDGKTKIFANYGQFFDRFKYELPRGSFGGDFFRRDFFEITPSRGVAYTSYTRSNILGTFTDPIGGQCPITMPTGYSVCQFDFRIATNIAGADIFETGAVDPNLKAARQSEWTIGAERQLGSNFLLSGRYTHKQVDRAIEDVGVFNSQGSEAYIIANPGFGLVCEVASTANLPCPKAERRYDAVEVRIDKRTNKYFFNGSYTWSRLFGNYSGLASTDEQGRNSPNVNRFFDLPPLGFTADGDPDNGLLATDRTHVVKAYGGYSFDWRDNNVNRTTVAAFTTFQSGTPQTTIYNLYSLGTTILNGRGDLGRTEMFTQTDFSVNHRYKFGRDNRLTLEGFVDIINLFDERNVTGLSTNISGVNFTATTLSTTQAGCTTCTSEAAVFNTIFNGPGIRQFVLNYINNTTLTPLANRRLNSYGLPNAFQGGRDVRFGARLYF